MRSHRAAAVGRALLAGLGAAMMWSACAEPLADEASGAEPKIRPTQGDSSVYRGYGDVASEVLDSASGAHRVWFTRTGEHAVPSADREPADGIPDFVQRVAETADAVAEGLGASGWREPLSDTQVGPRRSPDDGPAFDIYLVNFERADGLYFSEACTPSQPARCSGYIAMDNDFSRSSYRNYEEGVRVLVSHEYFHAVQAAYTSDLPAWWSEGTATWHEEVFDPSQRDFEGLASEFFRHPGRSMNGPTRGTFDGYSYGTAVFPYFLGERFGEELLVGVFEQIALGVRVEDAVVEAVEAQVDFDEAFAEFTAWTMATGERTIEGFGFPMAADFPELDAITIDGGQDVNWDVAAATWAASHAELLRPRPVRLELRALDGWGTAAVLAVVDPDDAASERFLFARVGESVELPAGAPLRVAIVNPDADAEMAARLAVRATSGSAPDDGSGDGSGEGSGSSPPDDDTPVDESGSSGGCSASAGAGSPALLGLLSCLLALRIPGLRRRSLTRMRHRR